MLDKIKENYTRVKNYIKDLAVHTQIEVAAGAVAGAIVLGSLSHAYETKRSLYQPISFSEYEQLEDSAHAQNRNLNELTWFYVGANDFTAKVMEAHNYNSLWGIIPEFHRDWFSEKLEQEMDTTGRRYRRNLRDFAREIPQHARGALRELSDLTSASQEGNNLRTLFGQTWNYDYTESGHWEEDETCTTDDKGHESCTTTLRYVCDNYHHTWTYNPSQGVRASQALIQSGQRVPNIQRLQIETPTHTNAWNEQVIRQSFRKMHNREPTQDEMLQASQLFKTGSQYEIHIDSARSLWSQFIGSDSRIWRNYLSTARTTHKTTGCYSTSGPREYEFAEDLQRRFGSFIEHEQSITRGMGDAISGVPELEHKIKLFFVRQNPTMRVHYPELTDEEIRNSHSPRRLSREVISEARNLYRQNIPKGNIDTGYRPGMVALFSLLGGILGGLAGLGTDTLLDKYVFKSDRRYY